MYMYMHIVHVHVHMYIIVDTVAYAHTTTIESTLQKTIRHSKVGTVSKKVKAPEITEADKLKAAIEVRKNSIKGSILDLWKRVQVTPTCTCTCIQLQTHGHTHVISQMIHTCS